MAISGLISNVQRFSVHDGPGIRTTVFLKGCPLRCAWCHNPETLSAAPEVVMLEGRCLRCGACFAACPQHNPVGEFTGPIPGVDLNERDAAAARVSCEVCGACLEACPVAGREIIGRTVTPDELVSEIAADRVFFEQSGGGVTFSGGEPLRQATFVVEVLSACRETGLHTALDTSGFAPREDLAAAARQADLVLYDLKCLDEARHREFCGGANTLILENLRWLGDVHEHIWLRVPLISGVNDTPSELDAMARLAAELPGIRQVHVLPYHRMGAHKAGRVGREAMNGRFREPSAREVEAAAEIFSATGLRVKVGG